MAQPKLERPIHAPIDPGKVEIRLLTIRKRQHADETIYCTLRNVSLLSKPRYFALSYTWGQPSINHIIVNGSPFAIRDNLYAFLCQVSLKHPACEAMYIWIDQITIDQSSISERNQQVAIMSLIYSSAEATIIWLGRGDSASRSDEIMDTIRQTRDLPEHRICTGDRLPQTVDEVEEWLPYPVWALARLLQCEYWGRLWIIQEIALAKAVTVLYGDKEISWSDLVAFEELCTEYAVDAFRALHAHSAPGTPLWGEYMSKRLLNLHYIAAETRSHDRRDRVTWVLALEVSREAKCTDIRDRVFGLMGVVSAERAVEVDYQIALPILFRNVIKAELKHSCERFFVTTHSPVELNLEHPVVGLAVYLVSALGLDNWTPMQIKTEVVEIALSVQAGLQEISPFQQRIAQRLATQSCEDHQWNSRRLNN